MQPLLQKNIKLHNALKKSKERHTNKTNNKINLLYRCMHVSFKENYYNQSEIFAISLKKYLKWVHIKDKLMYHEMTHARFISKAIEAFNQNAYNAILKSLYKINNYLYETYNIQLNYSEPKSIHYALLSITTMLWHKDMHTYFEIGNLHKLKPGAIISYANPKFLNTGSGNTGKIGCITSTLKNKEFTFATSTDCLHNIRYNFKSSSGPIELDLSTKCKKLKQIRENKIIGGMIQFKDTPSWNNYYIKEYH